MPNTLITQLLQEVILDEHNIPTEDSTYSLLSNAFQSRTATNERRLELVQELILNIALRAQLFIDGELEAVDVWYATYTSRPTRVNVYKTKYGYFSKSFNKIEVCTDNAELLPNNLRTNISRYCETEEQCLDWRVRQLTQFLNEYRKQSSIVRDYSPYRSQAIADYERFLNTPKPSSNKYVFPSIGSYVEGSIRMPRTTYRPAVSYTDTTGYINNTATWYTTEETIIND